jgi:hypothetical protein
MSMQTSHGATLSTEMGEDRSAEARSAPVPCFWVFACALTTYTTRPSHLAASTTQRHVSRDFREYF